MGRISASGGEREQASWNAWGMRGIGGGMGSISPQQNVGATMVVSLYDAKQQSLVWRGISQDTLNNNGNKNQQMLEKADRRCSSSCPSPNQAARVESAAGSHRSIASRQGEN